MTTQQQEILKRSKILGSDGGDIQPVFKDGFSTDFDPHAPRFDGVDVCVRNPHELYNKNLQSSDPIGEICNKFLKRQSEDLDKAFLTEVFNGFPEIGAEGFKIKKLIS